MTDEERMTKVLKMQNLAALRAQPWRRGYDPIPRFVLWHELHYQGRPQEAELAGDLTHPIYWDESGIHSIPELAHHLSTIQGRHPLPKARVSQDDLQHLGTALWSSTGDDEEPLDQNYSVYDIHPHVMASMLADWRQFRAEHPEIHDNEDQAAHDFWLSRNGHGTGFFVRGEMYGDRENARRLQDAAERYGEFNLEEDGDENGNNHVSGDSYIPHEPEETENENFEEPEEPTRMAAYRAPAGGTVVRGTYYQGGKMIPDLEGEFANPPAPATTPAQAPVAVKSSPLRDRLRQALKRHKEPLAVSYARDVSSHYAASEPPPVVDPIQKLLELQDRGNQGGSASFNFLTALALDHELTNAGRHTEALFFRHAHDADAIPHLTVHIGKPWGDFREEVILRGPREHGRITVQYAHPQYHALTYMPTDVARSIVNKAHENGVLVNDPRNSLPPEEPEQYTRDVSSHYERSKAEDEEEEDGEVKTVPIASILPDKDNLEEAVEHYSEGKRTSDKRPLEVYPYPEKDKYVLADGHHRLVEAICGGDDEVEVRCREHDFDVRPEGTVKLKEGKPLYGLKKSLDNGDLLKSAAVKYARMEPTSRLVSMVKHFQENPKDRARRDYLADYLADYHLDDPNIDEILDALRSPKKGKELGTVIDRQGNVHFYPPSEPEKGRYEQAYFGQGDDYDEPAGILDEHGPGRAADYMSAGHYPGENQSTDVSSLGSSDHRYQVRGPAGGKYIIGHNPRYGYISMEYLKPLHRDERPPPPQQFLLPKHQTDPDTTDGFGNPTQYAREETVVRMARQHPIAVHMANIRSNPYDPIHHFLVADTLRQEGDHYLADLVERGAQAELGQGEEGQQNLWYPFVENSWDGTFPFTARLGRRGQHFNLFLGHEGYPADGGNQRWVLHAVSRHPGSRDTGFTFEIPHHETDAMTHNIPAARRYIDSPYVRGSDVIDEPIADDMVRRFNDRMDAEERARP